MAKMDKLRRKCDEVAARLTTAQFLAATLHHILAA